jgi:hypothetical protein
MGLVETVTSPVAGDDGTATWAQEVYNDIGSIINYRLVHTTTYAATTTLDMNLSAIHLVTLTGDVTFAVSNVTDGQTFFLIVKQDGTGGHDVTAWWANIKWPSNTPPTLSQGANAYDIFAFTRIGSIYLASYVVFND